MKNKDLTPEQLERRREYQRRYKAANAERFAEYKKNYYEANKEKFREYGKQWRKAHPDYYKEWKEKEKEPKPKPAGFHRPITAEEDIICPVCGSKDVGKIGRSSWYCRSCAVEFTSRSIYELTKQGIRIPR